MGDLVRTAGGVKGEGTGGIDAVGVGLGAVDRVDGFGLGVVVQSDAAVGEGVPEDADVLGGGGSGEDELFEVGSEGKKVVAVGSLDQCVEINTGGLTEAGRYAAIRVHGSLSGHSGSQGLAGRGRCDRQN